MRSRLTLRRRKVGEGSREGEQEETRNIFAHYRNSEGQMFESFKTPETWICYSAQWQQGLSHGVPGMSRAITPPFSVFTPYSTSPLLTLNCYEKIESTGSNDCCESVAVRKRTKIANEKGKNLGREK